MPDGIEFDFSGITKLVGSINEATRDVSANARKAVIVTARHVKDDWQEPLKGSPSIPRGPQSISYDIKGGEAIRGDAIEAEIGPTVGEGGLGGLIGYLELGNTHQGPRGFGAAALEKNQADFEKGLSLAAKDAEKAAGL